MKLSYLQGKAVAIAGIELNDAMSAFGISGSIPAIREIKVGPVKRGPVGPAERICTVKVIFWEDFYTEITFEGELTYFGSVLDESPYTHWRVAHVVNRYYRDSMNSRNLYLY